MLHCLAKSCAYFESCSKHHFSRLSFGKLRASKFQTVGESCHKRGICPHLLDIETFTNVGYLALQNPLVKKFTNVEYLGVQHSIVIIFLFWIIFH